MSKQKFWTEITPATYTEPEQEQLSGDRSKALTWPSLSATLGASVATAAIVILAHSKKSKRSRVLRPLAAMGALAPWVYHFAIRPKQLNWGATGEEINRPLPGDDLVPEPWTEATRSMTINAPASEVWPALTQIGGYTRANWRPSGVLGSITASTAYGTVPELKSLEVGDIIPASSGDGGFEVVAVNPNRSQQQYAAPYTI